MGHSCPKTSANPLWHFDLHKVMRWECSWPLVNLRLFRLPKRMSWAQQSEWRAFKREERTKKPTKWWNSQPTNQPNNSSINQLTKQTKNKYAKQTNWKEAAEKQSHQNYQNWSNIKPKNKFQYIPAASPCATQTRRDYYSHRWPRKSYAVAVHQDEDRDLSAPRNLRGWDLEAKALSALVLKVSFMWHVGWQPMSFLGT